jgi:hypothetical protein
VIDRKNSGHTLSQILTFVIIAALTNTITTNSPAQASSYASAASSSSERLPWSPDLAQPANAEDVLANLHLGKCS